jgi:hypothetical protein
MASAIAPASGAARMPSDVERLLADRSQVVAAGH